MLRTKGLTGKLLLLDVDGMDPRFTKRLVEEGKMPNFKKLMDMGSCREDLMMLGVDIPAECEGAPAYQIFTESM